MNLNRSSGQKEPKNFGRRHNSWNNINQGKFLQIDLYFSYTEVQKMNFKCNKFKCIILGVITIDST